MCYTHTVHIPIINGVVFVPVVVSKGVCVPILIGSNSSTDSAVLNAVAGDINGGAPSLDSFATFHTTICPEVEP